MHLKSKERLIVSKFVYANQNTDKKITSLKNEDIKLKIVAKDGFSKLGFVQFAGDFSIFVENEGTYKLEVYHPIYYFEPVVVEVKDNN